LKNFIFLSPLFLKFLSRRIETKDMDNENYLDNYSELIFSYFNSSLSNEDKQILMDWLNKDVANKRYFDECHAVWLSTKVKSAHKDFDSQEAFQRFTNEIKHTISSEKYLFKTISISIGKAAAVLFITFLSGVLAFSLFHRNSPVDLTYFTITVPAGSKTKMNLPDGSQVWLNSQSKLTYASNYNQTTREVKLEGEGYFKVAHDKKRPFLVSTSKITIRALGTEFNVKCYAEEGLIETTLINGSVKIEGKAKKSNKIENDIILKPNEKLVFIKQTGRLYLKSESLKAAENQTSHFEKSDVKEEAREEKMIIRTIDPKPHIAWKEDKLVFTGESFDEIKAKLERWYGVTIQVHDQEIISYRFKGSFEKETLEQALEVLKLAAHFKYSIYKDHVIITK
jgi:transmembrane sensor